MYKDLFEEVSKKELSSINGGDYACNWAIYNCIHDNVLSALGTSDPIGKCEYMRRVCKN